MDLFGLFDKFAGVCKKLCYIALAVILLMVLSDRVRADDSEATGVAPAAITVQVEGDEFTGESKVTIYIRAFIEDVQDKYHEMVDSTETISAKPGDMSLNGEPAEAPKGS